MKLTLHLATPSTCTQQSVHKCDRIWDFEPYGILIYLQNNLACCLILDFGWLEMWSMRASARIEPHFYLTKIQLQQNYWNNSFIAKYSKWHQGRNFRLCLIWWQIVTEIKIIFKTFSCFSQVVMYAVKLFPFYTDCANIIPDSLLLISKALDQFCSKSPQPQCSW